eukprot:COSAG02_NODE_8235_length_2647_cov_1.845369_2_plen_173_part_00
MPRRRCASKKRKQKRCRWQRGLQRRHGSRSFGYTKSRQSDWKRRGHRAAQQLLLVAIQLQCRRLRRQGIVCARRVVIAERPQLAMLQSSPRCLQLARATGGKAVAVAQPREKARGQTDPHKLGSRRVCHHLQEKLYEGQQQEEEGCDVGVGGHRRSVVRQRCSEQTVEGGEN